MMRAAFDIYEHPDLTSSDVWSKTSPSAKREALYKVIAVLSLAAAASTYVVYRFTGLGSILQQRCVSFCFAGRLWI
ncbi:hypothetical protein ARMSODRAFT_965108 [Armillaria solidipes]|uniref:Uncharacterized protein n=1 Tax=Armillaria solidipes TaxID=1076256 RepID=A0A2H3AUT0_9AGAR|nr:hypothetical protein ARMSODRAFT_965108 [Armillaria solidipes]